MSFSSEEIRLWVSTIQFVDILIIMLASKTSLVLKDVWLETVLKPNCTI